MIYPPVAAAIQYSPVSCDIQKNIAVAQQMVFEAAAKGAHVIVLPELSLTGNKIASKHEAGLLAQDRSGYQSAAFYEIARKYKCYIALGYVELSEGKLYNSAVLIGENGILANARKRHLEGSDFLWAEKGRETFQPSIVTPEGRIGLLLTGDVVNEHIGIRPRGLEYHKKLYNKGAVDTICLLGNWPGIAQMPQSQWVNLAEDVGCNVIVSNRIGSEAGVTYNGGSCIIDKSLQVWTHGSSFTEAAVVGGSLIL
jgi:predicted amidohydrolase